MKIDQCVCGWTSTICTILLKHTVNISMVSFASMDQAIRINKHWQTQSQINIQEECDDDVGILNNVCFLIQYKKSKLMILSALVTSSPYRNFGILIWVSQSKKSTNITSMSSFFDSLYSLNYWYLGIFTKLIFTVNFGKNAQFFLTVLFYMTKKRSNNSEYCLLSGLTLSAPNETSVSPYKNPLPLCTSSKQL